MHQGLPQGGERPRVSGRERERLPRGVDEGRDTCGQRGGNRGCKTASVRSCGGTIWPGVGGSKRPLQLGGECGFDAVSCEETHTEQKVKANNPQQSQPDS